jgi:hypothetical protein
VSKIQHHTKLCSKYSTLPVCSLNLSPACWWKEFSSCRILLCYDNSGFKFTVTYFIICYHATQIVEIFHILHCFWSITICTGDGSLEILLTFVFSIFTSITLHGAKSQRPIINWKSVCIRVGYWFVLFVLMKKHMPHLQWIMKWEYQINPITRESSSEYM